MSEHRCRTAEHAVSILLQRTSDVATKLGFDQANEPGIPFGFRPVFCTDSLSSSLELCLDKRSCHTEVCCKLALIARLLYVGERRESLGCLLRDIC